MRILVLCDEGNNRSVTVAHQLKYWGHDVIPAGLKRNKAETLHMLSEWAERIILTEREQIAAIQAICPFDISKKLDLWDLGPDVYPRPFNKDMLAIVRRLMEAHKDEYKPLATGN